MNRVRQIRKFAAVLLICSLLFFARTGYLIIRPGSAEDLSRLVTVEQGSKEHSGRFFLVTVTQQNASLPLLLYGLLSPGVDIRPHREVIPPGISRQEYNDMMKLWMEESKNLAQVIALRRVGLEVPIESDGVEVVDVGEDSPARGILQPGDVIIAVDGQPVYLAEELVRKVQLRSIGDHVRLTIRRDGAERTVAIATTSHTENPGKAAIRVLVQTLNWHPLLPVDITIDAGEITGPSAGLMFVLEILNQIDRDDLTGGHLIAGTGTINLQEEVGAIGGVRQKVMAAEKAGAEFFFVPVENFADAQTAARHIKLVPVSTLSEVLDFLGRLADKM